MTKTLPLYPQEAARQRQRAIDEAVRATLFARPGLTRGWAIMAGRTGYLHGGLANGIRRRFRLLTSGRNLQGRFVSKTERVHAELRQEVGR